MTGVTDAYAIFQVEGVPTLVPSAVLFLDLLGTAQRREPTEAQDHLRRTHTAFALARDWGESQPGADDLKLSSWFSDNLAMAMPLVGLLRPGHAISTLAMYAAFHQIALSDAGLFARGAITFGPFYADEYFVHGPALNQAYELESKAAVYPRVILSPEASHELAAVRSDDLAHTYLAAGDDGVPFVDYLRYASYLLPEPLDGDAVAKHGKQVAAALQAARGNMRVEQKYAWLASYHDSRVSATMRGSGGRYACAFQAAGARYDVGFGSSAAADRKRLGYRFPVRKR